MTHAAPATLVDGCQVTAHERWKELFQAVHEQSFKETGKLQDIADRVIACLRFSKWPEPAVNKSISLLGDLATVKPNKYLSGEKAALVKHGAKAIFEQKILPLLELEGAVAVKQK